MKRLAAIAAAAVSVLVLATGCGVRPDGQARTLAANEVPYGLLDAAPPTSAGANSPRVERVNVAVYFLVGDHLQPAPRAVADPPTPARAVVALFDGPTDDEAVAGLRTAINPSTEVTVTRVSPELVAVDLSAAFAAVPTAEQRFALGQIVFTATGIAPVAKVRFTLGGTPVGVPLEDGTVSADPVGREAFPNMAPPAVPAPNTAA